ncbi:MAG TPA: hypothetical protein VND88_11675 [Candidatus Acidoferrales bacterium]|nr:hypothetical protein [Candidatus Acidoferrales bacterium]
MTQHYLDTFTARPATVELAGVQFGGVAGLDAALENGADVVVSLYRMGTKDVPDRTEHRVIGLIDSGPHDNPNLAFVLVDTADFIATRSGGGHKVYVHCVVAENRTPTVAATFLARHHGASVDVALSTLEQALGHRPSPLIAEGIRRAATL